MKRSIWIESRLLKHNFPTRFPRLYKFWDWVLQPGGLGFRLWAKWAIPKRKEN